jgi:hypothetical protein
MYLWIVKGSKGTKQGGKSENERKQQWRVSGWAGESVLKELDEPVGSARDNFTLLRHLDISARNLHELLYHAPCLAHQNADYSRMCLCVCVCVCVCQIEP